MTLTAELAAARAAAQAGAAVEEATLPTGAQGLVRRRLFCHRSPTDNLLVAMGRWMDEAVPLVPNRYQTALAASASGGCRVEAHTPSEEPHALKCGAPCDTAVCRTFAAACNCFQRGNFAPWYVR